MTRPFEGDLAAAVSVASEYDLCLSGDALHHLHQQGLDTIYVPLTQVHSSRLFHCTIATCVTLCDLSVAPLTSASTLSLQHAFYQY